jgi:hypothetical protein
VNKRRGRRMISGQANAIPVILVCALIIMLAKTSAHTQYSDKSRDTLRDIIVPIDPVFADALWPDEPAIRSSKIELSRVPKGIVARSIAWMRTVLRQEWLPEKIEDSLMAIKDLRKWEKRDAKGIVFSEHVGDYIMARYTLENHEFYVQENGSSLSLLVKLPHSADVTSSPQVFIRGHIEQFINFPSGKIDRLEYHLKSHGGLFYGEVTCERKDIVQELLSGKQAKSNMWWQDLRIATDGSFFFVAVPETQGEQISMKAKPGLPDRF